MSYIATSSKFVLQGEWNLPRTIGGINVKRVLSTQCAALYRGWRYRLKEQYYTGYSITEARRKKPEGISRTKWDWLIDEYWSDPKQQVVRS